MGERRLGIFQGDPLPRRTGQPPDRLEHRVQDGPGEILLGVRQLLRIVRAGGTAQGQEAFALQVWDVQRPLPARSVLDEVPGHLRDHVGVFSDELLLPLGEP